MKLSFGDLAGLHLENLDWLDGLLLVLLAAETAAIVAGVVALARGRADARGPARWSRASIALGLLAVVLSVSGFGMHVVRGHVRVRELGANVTAADLTVDTVAGFTTVWTGLLIAAVGLAGGWILEWFVDGREGDPPADAA